MARQDSSGSETKAPARLIAFPTATPSVSSKPPKRRWGVGAAIVLLVLAAAATGWWAFRSGEGVNYVTAAVTVGPIQRTVTATGTINPELTIIVGTYVSGVIQELYCDYNTQVKRGQVCAKIDERPYRTVVDQAQANLAVAHAQLEKDRAYLAYTKLAYERAALLVAIKRRLEGRARQCEERLRSGQGTDRLR